MDAALRERYTNLVDSWPPPLNKVGKFSAFGAGERPHSRPAAAERLANNGKQSHCHTVTQRTVSLTHSYISLYGAQDIVIEMFITPLVN